MASHPEDDGTGCAPPKDKKRRAGQDFEKQNLTKKKPESWYQRFNIGFLSKPKYKGKDNDAEESSDDDISPYPPIPLTVEEQAAYNKRVADFIDLSFAEDRSHDAAVNYAKNYPSYNLDITSKCKEWVKIRAEYVAALKDEPVKTILDKEKIHLDDVQKCVEGKLVKDDNAEGKFKYLQLLPPQTDGPILDIQGENTKLYKANLASDQFEGVHDNMATKLTMLHFGLPIEPLTLNNILNADKDQNDEADPAEELPRVQRIIYSEKPLEFLDSYHERSYGYPMLRRPKYKRAVNIPQPQGNAPAPNLDPGNSGLPNPIHAHHHAPLRTPIAPTGSRLSLRGGSSQTRTLYNHYGGHMKLPVDSQQLVTQEDFLKYLCKIMDAEADSAWVFIFDQYNNTEPYKNTAEKTFVRSFEATKDTFPRVYNSYLKARISNREEDWILVVQYKYCRAQHEAAPSTFKLPRNGKSDTNGHLPQDRPRNDPSATHEARQLTPPPPSKGPKRTLYWYSEATPYVEKETGFEDNLESLTSAVRRLLQKPTGKFTVNISLYTSPLRLATNHDSGKVWYHTEQFPHTANLQWFNNIVAHLANPDTAIHIIVAHPLSFDAPKVWPPPTTEKPQTHHPATVQPSSGTSPSFSSSSSSAITLSSTTPTILVDQVPAGHIFAYGGKAPVKRTAESFWDAALALLAMKDDKHAGFQVDFYTRPYIRTIDVVKKTLQQNFRTIDRTVTDDGKWPVFVRNGGSKPKVLQPSDDLVDVVKLRSSAGSDGRTTYWKIPTPVDRRYGINQIQNDFFSAMRILFFPGQPRSGHQVSIARFNLGIGGMEITDKLWDKVSKDVRNSQATIEYVVNFQDPSLGSKLMNPTFLRLVGSERHEEFDQYDPEGLAIAIRGLSYTVLDLEKKGLEYRPSKFRIWFRPEDREDGIDSKVYEYEYKTPGMISSVLGDWLESQRKTSKTTNCVWFRPEYETFEIIDVDNKDSTETWDATLEDGGTLESFRSMLVNLFKDEDSDSIETFEICVPDRSQRFVVDDQTTEEQWRMNIFDYFHHRRLHVKRRAEIPYELQNQEPPWGIWQRSKNYVQSIIEPGVNTTSPVPQLESTSSSGDDHGPTITVPPVQQPVHDGRKAPAIPGRKRPIARPTHVPRFDTWMTNQTSQNALQQRSWTQDQSVIEPGYQPEAPIFGDILELPITVGQNLPTVFAQHLTPTDIAQILQDKRKAVNHVLERQTACPLCETTFAAYDVQSKQAHFAEHNDQLKSIGNCPLCNDARWRFMTLAQKQEHLLADQSKRESKEIKEFWETTRCPICNKEFKDMLPDDVMTHIAGHIPGALKYCDRCGLDLLSCTPAEKRHHTRVCVHSIKPAPPPDLICSYCGIQRTAADQKGHDACGNGTYCIRCGLDLSLFVSTQRDEHAKHCRAPKGLSGKFCKRCGNDILSLDALGVASHNNECYRREPASVAAAGSTDLIDRAKAAEKLRLENDKERAEIRAEREELTQRTTAVENREADVRTQEIALLVREGAITLGGQGLINTVDMGQCRFPGCLVQLGTMTRQEIRDHFYTDHTHHVHDHGGQGSGSTFDMGICPITGCGHVLGQMSRRQLRAHFQTHGGLVSPSVASSNTGDSLFQCPLPLADGSQCPTRINPRGGDHQLIHHYQHIHVGSGQPCHSEALKNALRAFKDRMPDFRAAHLELERLAQLAQASLLPKPPSVERIPTSPHETPSQRVVRLQRNERNQQEFEVIIHATKEAEAAAKEKKERILATEKVAGERREEADKIAENSRSGAPLINTNLADPIQHQTGFLPSPARTSFKRFSSPRKARSVRGRAPTTNNKRKKAATDDSEDTLSGWSSVQRSPSKRETKKIPMDNEGGLSSPEKRRRRIQLTDQRDGSNEFEGEGVSMVSVPKRITRAASGTPGTSSVSIGGLHVAPPRKVGRPRKAMQPGNLEEEDGFEGVEEEDEEEERPTKRGRKNPPKK